MSVDKVTACGPPNWVPNYMGPTSTRGSDEINYWELVDHIKYNGVHFCKLYTGYIAYPDGQLLLAYHKKPVQCASLEAAMEFGMTTYLLTKEGE